MRDNQSKKLDQPPAFQIVYLKLPKTLPENNCPFDCSFSIRVSFVAVLLDMDSSSVSCVFSGSRGTNQ